MKPSPMSCWVWGCSSSPLHLSSISPCPRMRRPVSWGNQLLHGLLQQFRCWRYLLQSSCVDSCIWSLKHAYVIQQPSFYPQYPLFFVHIGDGRRVLIVEINLFTIRNLRCLHVTKIKMYRHCHKTHFFFFSIS